MNNKYLKMAFGLPLFMALLCGCSQADDCPGGDAGTLHRPLGVSSLLAPASLPHTRVTTSPLPQAGAVGFFVGANAPHYSAVNNKKGVYKADESLWLPTDSIWLSGIPAKLAVYYPYDAAQTTAGTLSLKAAVRTDDTKDLWSTRFEADSHTKDIRLTLTQLYSRLSITFVKLADAEYTGTSVLTGLKLTGAGIYAGATYNPLDGTYTHGTAGFTTALSGVTIKGTNAAADDATKVDLLLPPYPTLTENITLTVTVDTKDMKIVIPKAKLANALTAGKQYNITIKLKPTALVLGSIQTTDWDSQTAFNGDAEMENPPVKSIDIGLSFLIAPGNVRATSDGKGGYKYAFVEEQGYYTNTDSHFCWNTLEPIGSLNQASWDDARDPCREIDDGDWYTPTDAQLQELIDAGNVWGDNAYTMKDNTTVNGMYFGTMTVPAKSDQDKYVFLPAMGNRNGSNYVGVGIYGGYWSSTPSGSADYSYSMDFGNGYCYVVGDAYNRTCGDSLRCVRNK